MNWEQIYNALKDMIGDDGTMPDEFNGPVQVHIADDLTEVKLVQSMIDGELILMPVFKD